MPHDPREPPPAPSDGGDGSAGVPPVPATASPGVDDGGAEHDDFDLYRERRLRRTRRRTRLIAAVLAVGLLVPTGRWAVDEIRFRLSGAAVVETLEGERSGADLADTVLLVRAAGCRAGTTGSGSAFVLQTPRGPRLVTNRHVVEDTRRVGVTSLDASLTLEVTAIEVSEVADVAVLHVDDERRLPPPLALSDGHVTTGDRVRLVGFPAARPFTTAGDVAAAGSDRMLLDLQVDRGASGSPVVAEDGRVVGQIYAVTHDGRGVATPASRLPRALERTRPLEPC